MPTRRQVCAWIAAVGLSLPSVSAAQDRTERDVVDLIVREGPQARAIRAEAEVTRQEQRARLAYPNPAVTYSREGAGFTEFLQAEQALPIFGVRGALSRAGVAATAAAEADRDARLWQLRAEAATAVARLHAEQARLDAAEAFARDVARLIEILRTREREGEGSRFDRLRAEQELRETRQTVTTARAGVAEARAWLAGLLPAGTMFGRVTPDPDTAPLAATVDALTTRATTARAELRALQQGVERASLEGQAARRSRFFSPSVFGGMKRADATNGRETGGVFGLSVAVPLFDIGNRDAARWSAEATRLDAARAAVAQRIQSEIVGALEVWSLRLAAVRDDEPGAVDELVQIAEVGYREGELGIVELLDSVRAAARARLRTIELRRDARLAQIALERAVGAPLWP